jgi:hypothetical protein
VLNVYLADLADFESSILHNCGSKPNVKTKFHRNMEQLCTNEWSKEMILKINESINFYSVNKSS